MPTFRTMPIRPKPQTSENGFEYIREMIEQNYSENANNNPLFLFHRPSENSEVL